MLLTLLGISFLCLEVSGRFKIKVRKKNHFDWGTGHWYKMPYIFKTNDIFNKDQAQFVFSYHFD